MKAAFVVAIGCGLISLSLPDAAIGQKVDCRRVSIVNPVLARGGQIHVEVDEPQLVLCDNEGTHIEAKLPRGAKKVVFFAAHGRVTDVERESDTLVTAWYEAPDGCSPPQVDIVAALVTVRGEKRWGYASILLFGQGEADVPARWGEKAFLRIGNKEFGPVRADNTGSAKIPVEVPPGVRFGCYGPYRNRAILFQNVRPTSRTAVFAETNRIPNIEDPHMEIMGVIVYADGSIDDSSKLEFLTDKGYFKNIRSIGSGAFTAQYLPLIEDGGPFRVEVKVAGDNAPSFGIDMALAMNAESSRKRSRDQEEPSKQLMYITPTIGFGVESRFVGAFYTGLEVSRHFSLFGGHFTAGMELGFSVSSKDETVAVNENEDPTQGTVDITTRIVPITAIAGWRYSLSSNWTLIMLGQLGYALVNNQINTRFGDAITSLNNNDYGHCAFMGMGTAVEWAIVYGALMARVRYVWLPGPREMFDGLLSSLLVDFGYRVWFL
ncbi:MAG: hypothetical protein GY847_33940 [Proteobacteria bacterium]|nr:hypothetical protein [Pseudomonadota bacterium]